MALWAFHNNPGIGGFGEGSRAALLDGARIHARKRDRKLKEKKRSRRAAPPTSSNCEHPGSDATTQSSWNGDENRVRAAGNESSSIGEDAICQIVKELVDNAVDACRSPISDRDPLQHKCWKGTQKKRIRVDLRPAPSSGSFVDVTSTTVCPSKQQQDGLFQLTVTDNGCGMENIQSCVNAFQSSKDGSQNRTSSYTNKNTSESVVHNNNNISNGRYGIGLTLSLLHAQRCVPNSRACISSATPTSQFRTRVFFEVDKQDDSVKCVQEECIAVSSEENESGTCVSLLIPGGTAAKLAWPRLQDYFTRFGLCTKLHFELDVFAPTLSKLPIFIRSRNVDPQELRDAHLLGRRNSAVELVRNRNDSDGWEDLFDDDGSREEKDSNDTTALIHNKKWDDVSVGNSTVNKDPQRHEFFRAVQSFWPKHKVIYHNIARSVRNVRNYTVESTTAQNETRRKPEVQLEVSMAVCPHSDHDKGSSSADSAATDSNDSIVGDETAATLQLVRIINNVPIMETAEAHSCGLVHGIANKGIWGPFGLDIDKKAATVPSSSLCASSFSLRDNSLITPFINKNQNHTQLEDDEYDLEAKKRKRENIRQKALRPASIRIGAILVVVQLRAAPSSLPLPTLSKGRLPLNHQPIDSALELGLRDCIASLQSTNPALFLTTSQLRTVERDVRYIPGIASAVSRIILRSRNHLLRNKSQKLCAQDLTGNENTLQDSSSDTSGYRVEEQEHERKDLKMSMLTNIFESRLRLSIEARNELMNKNRRKRRRGISVEDEEYHDFDCDKENKDYEESSQVSIPNESGSFPPLPSSTRGEIKVLEVSSFSSLSHSSKTLEEYQRFENPSGGASMFPTKEIVIENLPNLSASDDEDDFDDFL